MKKPTLIHPAILSLATWIVVLVTVTNTNAKSPGANNADRQKQPANNPQQVSGRPDINPLKTLSFVENIGQVSDQYNQPRTDIQYRIAAGNGLNIFVGNGAIHYQFSKVINPDPNQKKWDASVLPFGNDKRMQEKVTYDMYRMDVELVGANKNARLITEQKQSYLEKHVKQGRDAKSSTAYAWNKITYKEVYPNIDWVLYISNGKLKHEFIVRRGGNVADIQLKYGGAASLQLSTDGVLTATTPQGAITEQAPYTYTREGGKVSSKFILKGDILSYETGSYEGELVIDPGLEWVMAFDGPGGSELSECISLDSARNVYVTGSTTSTSGIATTGAFQTVLGGGGYDAFLVKYNNAGVKQWATYYGGSNADVGLSCAVDYEGNVYMTGYTGSTGMATAGAHQTAMLGGTDAFIAKFNGDGELQWATYYGGSSLDLAKSIGVDKSNNIYICGPSASPLVLATSGAFQTVGGGSFLAKFNKYGVRQWGTYFSAVQSYLAVDTVGNVYLTGNTASSLGIATSGAYQTTLGAVGYYDAFIVKFDSNGTRQWGTYYGGSGDDEGRAIAVSRSGDIYFCGVTRSSTGIASSGSYQPVYHGAGAGNGFFARFNSSGERQWGSYYGTQTNECQGICTDNANNVYLTGTSTTAMATYDAYLTAGGCFLARFDSLGSRKWSSYYIADRLPSITLDPQRNMYVTGPATGPFFPGPFQYGSVAKFNANIDNARICVGGTITLPGLIGGGVWSSSNTAVATIGSATGLLTGLTAGTTLISYLTSTDYIITTVTVSSSIALFSSPLAPSAICSESTFNYACASTVSPAVFAWTRAGITGIANAAASGFDDPNETLINTTSAPITVVYAYTLTTSGCSAVQNVTVIVNPVPSAISGPGIICTGTPGTLTNTKTGGLWSRSNTNVSIGSTSGIVTGISVGTTNITYTMVGGCYSSTTVTVGVTPSVAGILGAATLCAGSSITLTNTTPGGTWVSASTAVATVGSATGIVTGTGGGTATITYAVTGSAGCSSFSTKTVTVTALPVVPAISAGSGTICQTSTLALTESTTGGTHTWSSGNMAVATINPSSGLVMGISPGTAVISYTYTLGCINRAFTTVTVNALTTPTITGTAAVCIGQTATSLDGEPGGGTWSSSAPVKATIDPVTGIVTGVAGGTVTMTYAYTTAYGCTGKAYTMATVNTLPSVGSISGTGIACVGATATLTNSTTGGMWTSTDPAIAGVGSTSGIVTGITAGTTIITYAVTGANSCVGTKMKTVTVNALPSVPAITGGGVVLCAGTTLTLGETTTGGTHLWISDNTAAATVNSSSGLVTGLSAGAVTMSYKYTLGCINYATTTLTVNPQTTVAITGTPVLCVSSNTTFLGDPAGGTWSSSTPAKATVDASTGYILGVAAGTTRITYSYTNAFGCIGRANVVTTVNALPSVSNIIGAASVCNGLTATLTDATAGGVWSSSNPAVAAIGSATGTVTGTSPGTTLITYSVTNANACTAIKTKIVSVNALPSVPAIGTGTGTVCAGATQALTESTSGGTHVWSSANTAVATINASTGVVTGITAGTTIISYSYTSGCTNYTTAGITVNPATTVDVISGPTAVAAGTTITLADATPGGLWSSSNAAKATIGSATGVVTGIAAGTTNITYTVTGCGVARSIQMITVSAARSGAENAITGSAGNISIFPNPTTGTFTVQSEGDGVLAVYTVDGKLVTQYSIYKGNTVLSLPYDIAAGMYLCRYTGNDGTVATVRLVYGN